MVLSERNTRLIAARDELAPGNKPGAIVPRTFAEAQAMCGALAAANLVPNAFRAKPQDMLVVLLSGMEVGIPPMAALRLYTTWDGVPRLMAEGVRAVILSHPDCEYFEPQTMSDTAATWVTKKRGRPEKSVTWTIERARKAGLDKKPIWAAYPEEMLNARASMQLGRLVWPEIVAGMVSREEAMDGDTIEASFIETKPVFVAPPPGSAPVHASGHSGPVGYTVPTPPAVSASGVASPPADPPRRGPGRPPKTAATPTTSSPDSTLPAAPSSPSQTASASTSSAPASDVAPAQPTSSPSSKYEEAKAAVEAKRDPTPAGGSPESSATASSPSTSSEDSTSSPESGASGDAMHEAADDAFGDEPVQDPSSLGTLLAGFYSWLSSCKTQTQLKAEQPRWKEMSVKISQAGDARFNRDGEGTRAMADAYAKRKTEVPV